MVNQTVVSPAGTAASLSTSEDVERTDGVAKCSALAHTNTKNNRFNLDDKVLISLVPCIPVDPSSARRRQTGNSVPPHAIHSIVEKETVSTGKPKQKEKDVVHDGGKDNGGDDDVCERVVRNNAKHDDGFQKNGAVEVYDATDKLWYRTRILKVNRDRRPPTIRIHYPGFSKIFDEDISFYSARLRPAGSGSVARSVGANVRGDSATNTRVKANKEELPAVATTKAEPHGNNSLAAPIRPRKRTISNTSTNTSNNYEASTRGRKQAPSVEPERKHSGTNGSVRDIIKGSTVPGPSSLMSRFLYSRKRSQERSDDFDSARNARKRSASISSAELTKSHVSNGSTTHDTVNGHSESTVGVKRPRRTGAGSAALKSLFSYGRNMGDVKIDLEALDAEERERNGSENEKHGPGENESITHRTHVVPGNRPKSSGGGLRASGAGHTRGQGKQSIGGKPRQRHTSTSESVEGANDAVGRPVRERRTGNGSSALNSLFSYGPTMGDVVIDFAALETEGKEVEEKVEERRLKKPTRPSAEGTAVDEGSGPDSTDMPQDGSIGRRKVQYTKYNRDSKVKARDIKNRISKGMTCKASARSRSQDTSSSTSAAVSDGATERVPRVRDRRTGDGRAALKSLFSYGRTMGDVVIDTTLLKEEVDGSDKIDTSGSEDKEKGSGSIRSKVGRVSSQVTSVGEKGGSARSAQNRSQPRGQGNKHERSLHKVGKASESGQESGGGVSGRKSRRELEIERHARDTTRGANGREDRTDVRGRSVSAGANGVSKERGGGLVRERVQPKRGSLGDDAKNSLFVDHPPWWEETVTLETGYDLSDEEVGDESEGDGESCDESLTEEKGQRTRTARSISTSSLIRGRNGTHTRIQARSRRKEGTNTGGKARTRTQSEAASAGASNSVGHSRTRTKSADVEAQVDTEHNTKRSERPKRGLLGDEAKNALFIDHPPWYEATITLDTIDKLGGLDAFDGGDGASDADGEEGTVAKAGSRKSLPHESGSEVDCKSGSGTETDSETESDECRPGRGCAVADKRVHESDNSEGAVESAGAPEGTREGDCAKGGAERKAMESRKQKIKDWASQGRGTVGTSSASDMVGDVRDKTCTESFSGVHGPEQSADAEEGAQQMGRGEQHGEAQPMGTSGRDTRKHVQETGTASVDTQAAAAAPGPVLTSASPTESGNSPRGDERVQPEGKATGKVRDEPTSPVDLSARLAKVLSRPHESGHDHTAAEGSGANEAGSRVVEKVSGDVGINDMNVDEKTNPVVNTDASSILPEDSSRTSPLITEDTKSKSSTSNANKGISSVTQDTDGAQAATTTHFEIVSTQVNNTNSDGAISMPPSSDHQACSTEPHNAANISKLEIDGNGTKQAPRDSNYTPVVDATTATADASTTLASGAFGTVAAASHEDDAVVEEGSLDGTLASVNLTSHKRHHWTPQALAMAMQGQHVGGHVFARWVDGVFYPVRVVGGAMSESESNSDPASVEESVKPSVGVSVTSDKAELDRRHSDSRGVVERLGESASGLSECRHSNEMNAASGLKFTAGDQAAEASTTSGADTNGRLTIGESEKANSALKVNGWLYYDVDFRPIPDSADSLEPLQKTASQDRNTNSNAAQQQSQLSAPPPLLKLPNYISNTTTTTDANINTTTGTITATTTITSASTSTGLNTNTTTITNAIAANVKSMHVKRVPWTDIIVPDAALEAKVSENTRRDTKRGIKRARALQRNKDGSLDGRTAAARALKMSKLGKGVNVGTYRAGTSKHTKVCAPNVNSRGDVDASAVAAANVIGGTDEGRSMRTRRNTTVSVSEGAEKETVPGHPWRSAGAVATGTPTDVNGSGAASVGVSGGGARRPVRERGVGKSGGAGQKLRQPRLGAQQSAGAGEQEAAVLAVATSGMKPAAGENATDGAVVKPQSAGEDSASTRGSRGVASQAPAAGVYGTKRPVRTRTQGIKRLSDAAKKEPMADTSVTAAAVVQAASPAVRGRRVSRSVSESSTHRASREHSSGKHARAQPKAKGAADVSAKADASSLSSTAAASTVGGANGEVSTADRRVSGKSVLPHLPVLMTSRGKIDGRSSAARGASMIARVSAMNARASGRGARAGGQRSRQSRHIQQATKHTAAETQTGAAHASSTHTRHRHSSVSSQSSASGRQAGAVGKGLELDREGMAENMLSGTGGRVRSRHGKDLAWGSNAGDVNDSLRSDGPLNMRRTKSEAVASSNDKSEAGASYKTITGICAATDLDTPWSGATSRKTSTHKPPMVERHVQCMCGGVAIVGKGMQCATCEHWSHDACVQLSARVRQSATARAEISTGARSAVASPFTCFRCERVPNPLLFRAEEILSEDLLPVCATAAQLRSSVLNEGQAVHRAGAKSSTNVMPAQKPSHIRTQMSEPPMQGHPHALKCRLDGPRSMTELSLALPQTHAQTTGAEAHGQRLISDSTCAGVTALSIPPQACAHTHSPGSASANEEQPVRGPEPPPSRTVPFTQSTQTLNMAPHSGNSASVLATAIANACVSVREDEAPQRPSFDHASSPGIGLGAGTVSPLTTTISSDHAVPVTDVGRNYSTAPQIAPFSEESNAGQTSAGDIRTKCDDSINTPQTTSYIKEGDVTWDSTLPRNPGSGPEYTAQKDLTEIASAMRVDLASRVAETSPTRDCVRADAMSSVNAGDNSKTYTPSAVYNSQATPAVTDLAHTRSVKSAQSDDGFLGNRESFSLSPSPPIPLSPTPSPSPTQSPAVVSSAPFRAESVSSDITMLANTLVTQPDMSTRQRTIAADGSGVTEFVDAESDRTATSDLKKVHLQRASTWKAYNLAKSRLRPVTLAVNACAHQLSRCRSALLSLPETVDMSPQRAGSSVEPIVSGSAYSQSQSTAPIEQSSSLVNERGLPPCDGAPPKQNTPPPSKLSSADYVIMLEQIEYWQETLLQNLEVTRGLISPI